jgi:hypothetical protein
MFVDDVNAAGRDKFGTQNSLELLRQWCAIGGWHNDARAAFTQVCTAAQAGFSCLQQLPRQG